jgi:RNA 3'-phosphate cyclase
MIVIDGAEGGGQILRNAVALSVVAGRPVRVAKIRGARPKPGLQAQHLVALRAAADLSGARLTGGEIGSREIEFHPGPSQPPAEYSIDIGTAGSATLVLQCLLPIVAQSGRPCALTLRGGTNNPWAPPFEYFSRVFAPAVSRMGVEIDASLEARGFYPKGGGILRVRAQAAAPLSPIIREERGRLVRLRGLAYSSNLPAHIVERMAEAARSRLPLSVPVEMETDADTPSPGPGCGILLVAEFDTGLRLGADALGERGKPAETVGEEAAAQLLEEIESGAATDRRLSDQLVIWAVLADGESRYTTSRLTDHTRAAIAVAEQITGRRFQVDDGRITVFAP